MLQQRLSQLDGGKQGETCRKLKVSAMLRHVGHPTWSKTLLRLGVWPFGDTKGLHYLTCTSGDSHPSTWTWTSAECRHSFFKDVNEQTSPSHYPDSDRAGSPLWPTASVPTAEAKSLDGGARAGWRLRSPQPSAVKNGQHLNWVAVSSEHELLQRGQQHVRGHCHRFYLARFQHRSPSDEAAWRSRWGLFSIFM